MSIVQLRCVAFLSAITVKPNQQDDITSGMGSVACLVPAFPDPILLGSRTCCQSQGSMVVHCLGQSSTVRAVGWLNYQGWSKNMG